ncbi:uncharacterized protein LOC129742872 [Uranotaenia lowii]|uniref:uncharacterized protein LOC129742872 n=1 Tax=Uranotaenia lowii TaxID=190385 RepID=UPI00247ACBBB|nr:uncharacterized protein LOC129742872 [Uranotaenia lowii]
MTQAGGFNLHKWASNHPELLRQIDNTEHERAFFEDEKTTRTLGLTWQPKKDVFFTKFHGIEFHLGKTTKGTICSDIAKLYDPLGLLGPLIFAAKVRMQKIWQLNEDWDEILARNDAEIWEVFRNQLNEMGEIVIPRCVFPHSNPQSVELHGFCDASSLGYGACVKIILWCDSTTPLSWIKTDPSRLKIYVSNRVIKIQELAKCIESRYVGTHDNPADVISRGLLPSEKRDCELWWSGPNFLYHDEEDWPKRFQHIPTEQLPETKNTSISLTVTDPPAMFYLFATEQQQKNAANNGISSTIDQNMFCEGGGRIRHAQLPESQKHPIILPATHCFTHAVIRAYHVEMLHAAQQLLLCGLRNQFWILHGRSTVRRVFRRCVTCMKAKPAGMQQKMGDLPIARLEGVHAFYNTGVDFAGPIYLRQHNKRRTVSYKAYVAVFVCFATRAIHLELVGDLTADSFITALHRFVSRRSKCTRLFSDNGLNFVGSRSKLREMYDLFQSQLLKDKLNEFCSKSAIEWKMIPPNAPHFAGLWEAGVRSAKYHLKRITGTANMNFEKYTTVLARIEALLNSRPITPLSEDPQDLRPLTPGHFLVGRPLTDIAKPRPERKESTLSRWQRHSKMVQHFWDPGQLVIIREDNVPTIAWRLGRIETAIPGPDGLVRVADVRVADWSKGTKIFRRPIAKLCLRPIEDNEVEPEHDSKDGNENTEDKKSD